MKARRQTTTFLHDGIVAIMVLLLQAAGPADAQQQTEVLIRSTPPGASITVNGETAGVSPLSLPVLPAGRHLVVATLRGFRPLYKTVEIAPGERTVLDLTLEPLTGLLLVHSTPPGAELTVNDVHRGTTPALITDLPPGAYRLKISKTGFLPRLLDATIDNRTPKRIHTDLAADTATLTVKATPEGADISIDGMRLGTSPCTLQNIRTGNVSISIAAPGHRLFVETLSLQAGEHREIDIALKPEPSSLTVSTTPPGARIVINDQFRGRSPVKISNIAVGEYVIRTELEAHDPATRSVRIGLGSDLVEDIPLTANAGQVEITTEPAGVGVQLNGIPRGETQSEPGKTDKISAAFSIPLVLVGTHSLKLTKVGFYPLTREITIVRNETHTGHYILTRRFIPNTLVKTSTETYRGILVERDAEVLKLELRPGVFKTLLMSEISAVTPLRTPELPVTDPDAPLPQ
jgi:hypothetical protein